MNSLLRFLFSFFCVLVITQVSAQCGITAEAGPDAAFCPGGGRVQLNANIDETNLKGFTWSPTTGLNNPTSLNPTATVSAPIIYTLTAEVFDPARNLIVNGDFETGDSDFTTDYAPGSGGPFGLISDEGEYAISTNSRLTHTNFDICNDHTGGGNMMVVNGSGIANDNIWCQTVTVLPNVTYFFNAWLMSALSQNPAQLQFSVNGTLLGGDFRASSTACAWNRFTETWESGAASSAQICITNQNTGSSGNDFAIDDLFFGPICIQTDEVEITEVALEAQVTTPVSLPCDPSTGGIQLDGSGSSEGPNYFYEWTTTNGNIVGGANTLFPTVDAPGEYTVNIRFDDGVTFCTDQASVVVNANNNVPSATATLQSGTITCRTEMAILSAAGSSTGPNIFYEWITSDGNIVAGGLTDQATVDQAGTYELVVTNSLEGCFDVATVVVTADTAPPLPAVSDPVPFTCNITSQRLDASGSVTGGNFSLLWTTADGNIVSGTNTLDPLVDALGTYTLTITNEDNGCSTSQSVAVRQNTAAPAVEAGPSATLTCTDPRLRLAATDLGSGFRYQWTTANGAIDDGADGPGPLISAPATYFLTVTNDTTGCFSRDSAVVTANQAAPAVDLGPAQTLTCDQRQLRLNDGAAAGANLTYAWSTSDGNLLSPTDTPLADVDDDGNYSLTVTDTFNGCATTEIIGVSFDTLAPVLATELPGDLTCVMDFVDLSGSITDGGANPATSWSTADGNIVSGQSSLTPRVDAPGSYQLRVEHSVTGCFDSLTVTVVETRDSPAATIAPPGLLTCADDVLILDGSLSDEGSEFSWTWGTDDGNFVGLVTNLKPEIDRAGTYFITVNNLTTGCRASDTVMVAANQVIPDIDVGPEVRTLTCVDTAAVLGAAAGAMSGLTYRWAALEGTAPGSPNQPTIRVQTGGIYELRITDDATGCLAADTVAVRVNQDVPDAAIVPVAPLNCTVVERTLSAAPAAPGQTVAYRWATTAGNIVGQNTGAEITANRTGTYQLFTLNQDNGCTDSTTFTLSQDTLTPRINLPIAERITCRNPEVELNASFSNAGNDFAINWLTDDGNIVSGSNTPRVRVNAAGTYVLMVTNRANNCSSVIDVVVERNDTPPALSAPDPAELNCRVLTSQINATNATFGTSFNIAWSTANGNLLAGGNTLNPTVNQPGTYELTVIDEGTACRSTIAVVVIQDVAPPTVNPGAGYDLGCEVLPVLLDAGAGGTGPFTYAWTTADGLILEGQSLGQPTIQGGGTYAVEVVDQHNFCSAAAEITLIQNLLLGFGAERTVPTCLEPFGSIVFTEVDGGNAPFLYSIDGGSGFAPVALADSLAPGRYDLVVQDANGCETAEPILIPNVPELDLFVGSRAVVALGDSYVINTRSNFADTSLNQVNWTPVLGLDCTDCLRPTATPTATTTYAVSVVSFDGCTATDSIQLVVDDLLRIYFPNGFSPNGDGLNDVFLPLGDPAVISSIQDFTVFDRWGETVHNATNFLPNDPANGWDGQLNGRPLNPAVYVYTATVAFVNGRVVTFRGDLVLMR